MNVPFGSSTEYNRRRMRKDSIFKWVCFLSVAFAILVLGVLLVGILASGLPHLNMGFLTNLASRKPEEAGIKVALQGTLWIIGLTILISVPVGIAAAIYLQEFAKKNRINAFIQLNIANLASVPSIIYALLGLALFVRFMDLGRSIIAGALTMSLLILPMIIITTQEVLKAVPSSLRENSLALGSTPFQAVVKQVLPAAAPGIMTAVILGVSRAMGETAPLITMGQVFVSFSPENVGDKFTALPLQIFNWAGDPRSSFRDLAATAIIILLAVLLTLNAFAILLRNRFQRSR
ncbi:MAG: phosphate ABC transporter permease PstA [Armatimonadetes bacterium]|nr:phosphate ABC transporter permease PstA [Armatimonadota bacterium]